MSSIEVSKFENHFRFSSVEKILLQLLTFAKGRFCEIPLLIMYYILYYTEILIGTDDLVQFSLQTFLPAW